MLDRLLLDFKQSQRLIRQLFIREVGNLRLLEPFKGETTEKTLPDVLIEYLEREFKFLRRHIMSIRTMFSDYLLIRNSFAMYRLQWSMWLLTLLMAVVAVTQLFGSCHTDGSHAVK